MTSDDDSDLLLPTTGAISCSVLLSSDDDEGEFNDLMKNALLRSTNRGAQLNSEDTFAHNAGSNGVIENQSSDEEDDDKFNDFIKKMKTSINQRISSDSGGEEESERDQTSSSLDGFIVPDDVFTESESDESADGQAFYLKTTNLLNKKAEATPIKRDKTKLKPHELNASASESEVSVSASDDSLSLLDNSATCESQASDLTKAKSSSELNDLISSSEGGNSSDDSVSLLDGSASCDSKPFDSTKKKSLSKSMGFISSSEGENSSDDDQKPKKLTNTFLPGNKAQSLVSSDDSSSSDDLLLSPNLSSQRRRSSRQRVSSASSNDEIKFKSTGKNALQLVELSSDDSIEDMLEGLTLVPPGSTKKVQVYATPSRKLKAMLDKENRKSVRECKENLDVRSTNRQAEIAVPPGINTYQTPANQRTLRQPLSISNKDTESIIKRSMSFLASLSSHVTSEVIRHPDSLKYINEFKKHRDELLNRLFQFYNETVFDKQLDDVPVMYNKRLLKTAGYCKYLSSKPSNTRQASIELSEKVCQSAERVRDTLIHEMCHAAVWIVNGEQDGHGRYWQLWVRKSQLVHPELPAIKRCHSYDIATKYIYKCDKCGQQVGRHSKSLDTVKKVCGICRGKFSLFIQSGNEMKTPTRTPNKFALFVKENFGSVKKSKGLTNHKDVMKELSLAFAKTKLAE